MSAENNLFDLFAGEIIVIEEFMVGFHGCVKIHLFEEAAQVKVVFLLFFKHEQLAHLVV